MRKLGYKTIDGVDISTESLKISKDKGLYRRLICDHIGTNRLDIKDGKISKNKYYVYKNKPTKGHSASYEGRGISTRILY